MSVSELGHRTEAERNSARIAEEARDIHWQYPSFCEHMFHGEFRFDLIYPFPNQEPEDKLVGDSFLKKLVQFFEDNKNNLDGNEVSESVLRGLKALGAFGINIPKEFGGLGLSESNCVRIYSLIASYSPSLAVILAAHQSIGAVQPLKMFGTKAQKQKYLPRLAGGEISAYAFSEKGLGSDPSMMKTSAEPTADGESWVIKGEKLWVTNGAIADVIVVFAVTPSIRLANGQEKTQITAFLVEKRTKGVEIERQSQFLGLQGVKSSLIRFNNVRVPKENILWGVGKGLRLQAMTMNSGRISTTSIGMGLIKSGLQIAKLWSKERDQWGKSIGEHESVASRLLFTAAVAYATDAVSVVSAGLVDRGSRDFRIESSITKLFTNAWGVRALTGVMKLRGGRGLETGESLKGRGEDGYPLEKMYRDFHVQTYCDGSPETIKLLIAREAIDRHFRIAGKFLDPEATSFKKASALAKAIIYYCYWIPKQYVPVFWPSFATFGTWESKMLRSLKSSSRKLSRAFFFNLLKYRGNFEKQQLMQAKLVEVGVYIFVLSSAMSLYLTKKKEGQLREGEGKLLHLIADFLTKEIQVGLRSYKVSDRRFVDMSRKIMLGDYDWIESDIGLMPTRTESNYEPKQAVAEL